MKLFHKIAFASLVAVCSIAATIKISDMTSTTTINNADIIPIVQSGANKSITFLNVKSNILATATNSFAPTGSVGLFFGGVSNVTITNLSIVTANNGQLIINSTLDAASTILLPNDATQSFPIGGYCYVYFPSLPSMAGEVGGTATITRFGSGLNIGGVFAVVKCYKVAANTWHVDGDVTIP